MHGSAQLEQIAWTKTRGRRQEAGASPPHCVKRGAQASCVDEATAHPLDSVALNQQEFGLLFQNNRRIDEGEESHSGDAAANKDHAVHARSPGPTDDGTKPQHDWLCSTGANTQPAEATSEPP